ncbi:MAG: hypothetical protein ACXW2A_09705, partial [Burkholderiales bacterium]
MGPRDLKMAIAWRTARSDGDDPSTAINAFNTAYASPKTDWWDRASGDAGRRRQARSPFTARDFVQRVLKAKVSLATSSCRQAGVGSFTASRVDGHAAKALLGVASVATPLWRLSSTCGGKRCVFNTRLSSAST